MKIKILISLFTAFGFSLFSFCCNADVENKDGGAVLSPNSSLYFRLTNKWLLPKYVDFDVESTDEVNSKNIIVSFVRDGQRYLLDSTQSIIHGFYLKNNTLGNFKLVVVSENNSILLVSKMFTKNILDNRYYFINSDLNLKSREKLLLVKTSYLDGIKINQRLDLNSPEVKKNICSYSASLGQCLFYPIFSPHASDKINELNSNFNTKKHLTNSLHDIDYSKLNDEIYLKVHNKTKYPIRVPFGKDEIISPADIFNIRPLKKIVNGDYKRDGFSVYVLLKYFMLFILLLILPGVVLEKYFIDSESVPVILKLPIYLTLTLSLYSPLVFLFYIFHVELFIAKIIIFSVSIGLTVPYIIKIIPKSNFKNVMSLMVLLPVIFSLFVFFAKLSDFQYSTYGDPFHHINRIVKINSSEEIRPINSILLPSEGSKAERGYAYNVFHPLLAIATLSSSKLYSNEINTYVAFSGLVGLMILLSYMLFGFILLKVWGSIVALSIAISLHLIVEETAYLGEVAAVPSTYLYILFPVLFYLISEYLSSNKKSIFFACGAIAFLSVSIHLISVFVILPTLAVMLLLFVINDDLKYFKKLFYLSFFIFGLYALYYLFIFFNTEVTTPIYLVTEQSRYLHEYSFFSYSMTSPFRPYASVEYTLYIAGILGLLLSRNIINSQVKTGLIALLLQPVFWFILAPLIYKIDLFPVYIFKRVSSPLPFATISSSVLIVYYFYNTRNKILGYTSSLFIVLLILFSMYKFSLKSIEKSISNVRIRIDNSYPYTSLLHPRYGKEFFDNVSRIIGKKSRFLSETELSYILPAYYPVQAIRSHNQTDNNIPDFHERNNEANFALSPDTSLLVLDKYMEKWYTKFLIVNSNAIRSRYSRRFPRKLFKTENKLKLIFYLPMQHYDSRGSQYTEEYFVFKK